MDTNIRLSTIIHPEEHSLDSIVEISPILFANGKPGKSIKPIRGGGFYSSDALVSRFLQFTGLDLALQFTAKEAWDLLNLNVNYAPFPEGYSVPILKVWSDNPLRLNEALLRNAEVKPTSISSLLTRIPDSDETVEGRLLQYEFLKVIVIPSQDKDLLGFWKGSDVQRVRIMTDLSNEHAKYEEFRISYNGNGKSVVHTGNLVEYSSSGVVSELLEITGLDKSLKEYPPKLLTEHGGKRFRSAKAKDPDELRVVYDPFPNSIPVPILKILPTTEGIWMARQEFEKVKAKPIRMNANVEGVDLDYPFLKVIVFYHPREDRLREYHGDSIVLE